MSRLAPPSGDPPPGVIRLSGSVTVALEPVAETVCKRYYAEFSDEHDRYGDAGEAWCLHDNLYLLAWAIGEAELGSVDFDEQVRWLATILSARSFPLERLARDLELASEALLERHPGLTSSAEVLRRGAGLVRSSGGN